jgi:hypothetical protein
MKRTRDSHAKIYNPQDDSRQPGGSMAPSPRPISTFARIDAETHHILPEESWFGAEFDNRAASGEQKYAGADTHRTGAYTVWGPGTVDLPEDNRPYAIDASRLDDQVTKKEECQARAKRKYDQLVRHALIVGDHDRLRPLLALPNVSDREQERGRQTAQRLTDQYIFESSEDEATPSQVRNNSQKKVKKGRFVKLKEALAKLEMPTENPPAGQHVSLHMTGIEKNRANPSVVNDSKDGSLPTLGFQKAMRNPSHPDFGMDFTSALGLAMAKEKKAHVLAARDNHWLTDDGDSDTIALAAPRRNLGVRLGHAAQGSHASPRPQTRQHSFDKNKVSAQQKFDIVEYTVAKASELGGLDFRDARLVDIFNGIMQRDNPRRPIRNQATLLAISYTDPVEYFGEDLQTLLESETYSEQVGRAIARLLPDSRLS